MKPIIGICGLPQVGKDTMASVLVAQGWHRLAFADRLKDTCAVMFGVPRPWFDDPARKEQSIPYWGLSPRRMAQLVGTEVARNIDMQHWVRRIAMDIEELGTNIPHIKGFVFTDARFENEADFIRKNDGMIVHLERPNNPVTDDSGHSSNAGIQFNAGDITVVNEAADAAEFTRYVARVLYPEWQKLLAIQ